MSTTSAGDVLVLIGTRKGLWMAHSSDGRQSWKVEGPHFLMREVASVAYDGRSKRILVGTMNEHWGPTVMWSDDLGATWHETPEGPIRFPEDTGAALARVWQIAPDTADRPGVVWAGVEPTSLWRSEDGGETFDLVRALWDHPHRAEWGPGYGGAAGHTVLAPPRRDDVVVAMSAGGVYVSEDGAHNWAPHNRGISAYFFPDPYPEFGQCVHKVARDAGDPDRLYAQNHHGVYRSDDGGQQWVSIAEGLPSDFGFPVLASPRHPGTAWVVPLVADRERVPPGGRLRVHRTRDAGETWQELGVGLPDDCWNAVLRDAACVDAGDPTGLYVGTRDGVVYASADDGDTWQVLAEHLPDVLSVRAAVLS
ncbi:MAG: WD40/YVTN/BNR-like repeat-containing protein [Actinomycetales bacterium]